MDVATDDVRSKIIEIVRASLPGQASLDALEDVNLIDDLGLDSVQILDLLMTVEETFGIAFDEPDVDLDSLMRVGALVEFVVRRRAPATQH